MEKVHVEGRPPLHGRQLCRGLDIRAGGGTMNVLAAGYPWASRCDAEFRPGLFQVTVGGVGRLRRGHRFFWVASAIMVTTGCPGT